MIEKVYKLYGALVCVHQWWSNTYYAITMGKNPLKFKYYVYLEGKSKDYKSL